MTEQLVDMQSETLYERETDILGLIGKGGYLDDAADVSTHESAEEMDKEEGGVVETAGVNELNFIFAAVVKDAAIVYPLPEGCHLSAAVISQYLVVDISAAMSGGREIVIAEVDLMTILTKPLDLIVYLLADATCLGKTMMD